MSQCHWQTQNIGPQIQSQWRLQKLSNQVQQWKAKTLRLLKEWVNGMSTVEHNANRPLGSQKASTSNPWKALRQQLIIAAFKLQLSYRAASIPVLRPSANGFFTPAIWWTHRLILCCKQIKRILHTILVRRGDLLVRVPLRTDLTVYTTKIICNGPSC